MSLDYRDLKSEGFSLSEGGIFVSASLFAIEQVFLSFFEILFFPEASNFCTWDYSTTENEYRQLGHTVFISILPLADWSRTMDSWKLGVRVLIIPNIIASKNNKNHMQS